MVLFPQKSSIVDVWLGSKYASGCYIQFVHSKEFKKLRPTYKK